jgi:hypothetical protein
MRELPPSETGVYPDEWVAEHFPLTDRIAPELAPGDALIFDHSTLHRTQPLDRETVSRMSIECRITRYPAYLALSQASSWLPGRSPPQPRSPRLQQDVQSNRWRKLVRIFMPSP